MILLDHCFIHQTVVFTIHHSRIWSWSSNSQGWQHSTEWGHRAEPEYEASTLYRSAQSRELLKPHCLYLFPWLCSPSSHPQSIPAIHTRKNSPLIYLQNPGSQEYVKPFCCAAPFPRAKLQTIPKGRSQSRKKNLPHPQDLTLPLAASRLLSWLNRPVIKKNPSSLGTTSHRRLALMDVNHSALSHMGLTGRSYVKI